MQYWTELRTALMLARHGTVSGAAEALGVHRATVNRHIDTLEAEFQTRLFQRHARGYTLTESGQEMLDVAGRADEMFADLAGRNRGRSATLSGNLIVTSLSGIAPLVAPALREFHLAYPQIKLEFAASADLARLEHGEAHVAFRAGPKPDTPDYVVTLFRSIRFGLYASSEYIRRRGQPVLDELRQHSYVGSLDQPSRLPFAGWAAAHVGAENITLKTTDQYVVQTAVTNGIGVGFIAEYAAADDPNLVEVSAPSQDWSVPIWIVTHVDLHRTEKVQQFLKFTKLAGPQTAAS
ncbi:LysR family transcriptional regulator [Pseudohoeflea coraliihabitans]|uniref:LysR family transcriptional regulator n=1 Tax=Pseudohoeflea coraliihabitans TaxID=2860393 RepID=A0ABS6WSE8_9HYPH|nr:LysR family transcriptional regulator [Pseudohoeflea sp. DP4N28-3]MBW3098352.1 LysR family transcriptional regulator [Pseudohoeflea sp. DP4N28-3]